MTPLFSPVGEHDHVRGPADAAVTLVEYGDFECPYCGALYPVVERLSQDLGGAMRLVFRHFPLSRAHAHAEHAAEMAEAAGEIGAFWRMHALLFENQSALDDRYLALYAGAVGLDAGAVAAALSGRFAARIRADFRDGVRSGVNGTPTLFINGVRYDGGHDEVSLRAELSAAARHVA